MNVFEADWICPISSPPIRNGFLAVDENLISSVGAVNSEGFALSRSRSADRPGAPRSASAAARSLKDRPPLQQSADWRTVAYTGTLFLFYVLLMNPLGYLIATAIFLFIQARLLGSHRVIRDGVFSIVTSVAAYALFNLVLKIGLPAGLFG